MNQGGPDMWILLVLSIAVVAVVIERLVFFFSQHGDTKALLKAIGDKIAADDLPDYLERVVTRYTQTRLGGESFASWVSHVTEPELT